MITKAKWYRMQTPLTNRYLYIYAIIYQKYQMRWDGRELILTMGKYSTPPLSGETIIPLRMTVFNKFQCQRTRTCHVNFVLKTNSMVFVR